MLLALLSLLACSNGSTDDDSPVGPEPGPTTTVPVLSDDAPKDLRITEVQSANDSYSHPTDLSLADWVELHNNGDEEVDLSRVSLEDDNGEAWIGTGVLAPGERMVLYGPGVRPTDGTEERFEHELPFGIDVDGDTLFMKWDGVLLKRLQVPELDEDVSYALIPDEGDAWALTAQPTPNAVNPASPTTTLNAADETLFRMDKVHRIDFTLTEQAYNLMNGWAEREVPAEFSINDETFYVRVGLQLKGSASFDTMDGKPAFKVDFNQYAQGHRYRGMKAFNLHNGNVLDPTRVRDHITYKLAREAGLMAPRVGWADVYVNGNHYGIYMIIEQHDDEMIDYHYPGADEDSYLFEPNETQNGGWGGDFGSPGDINFDVEEGLMPMPAEVMAVLNDVDALVGGNTNNVSDARADAFFERVDEDKFLSYLAWESVVMHTDGYRGPNNWRLLYLSTTGKLEWVPAGAEWTWDYEPLVYTGMWSNAYQFCLGNESCKLAYSEKLLEMADLADGLDLTSDFEQMSSILDPYIDADPRSRHSTNVVNNARRSTDEHIRENPEEVRRQVYQEYPSLRP